MTDDPNATHDALEPNLAALLGRARAGLAPSSAVTARVRAAVAAAGVSKPSGPVDEPARNGSASPAPLARAAAAKLPLVAKLAAIAVVAMGTGVGGYVLGYRAGSAERARSSEPVAVIQIPAALSLHVAPALPDMAAPAPEPTPAARGGSAAEVSPVTAPSAPAAAPSGRSSLELETRLFARVERALRESNPRLALGLLGELERDVPAGQLREEREAARVIANCALGTRSAAKLASEFRSRHSNSAYAARIADACATSPHQDASE